MITESFSQGVYCTSWQILNSENPLRFTILNVVLKIQKVRHLENEVYLPEDLKREGKNLFRT